MIIMNINSVFSSNRLKNPGFRRCKTETNKSLIKCNTNSRKQISPLKSSQQLNISVNGKSLSSHFLTTKPHIPLQNLATHKTMKLNKSKKLNLQSYITRQYLQQKHVRKERQERSVDLPERIKSIQKLLKFNNTKFNNTYKNMRTKNIREEKQIHFMKNQDMMLITNPEVLAQKFCRRNAITNEIAGVSFKIKCWAKRAKPKAVSSTVDNWENNEDSEDGIEPWKAD